MTTLNIDEMVIKPSGEKSKLYRIRIALWIFLGIVLALSIVFGDNLFKEMSTSVRWLIISMICGTAFIKPKNINEPSKMELQLFDDYFILYRPKRYYSKHMVRREFNKVYYSRINSFEYRSEKNMVVIKADIETVWYKYDSNGNLSESPYQNKIVENGLLYFNTKFVDAEKLVYDIEQNSPIKIIRT